MAGERKTSDPREFIMQDVRGRKTKEYYAERLASKGGARPEIFDTVAWDNVAKALEGTSKIYKMWYAKQGLRFSGIGHWTSKWEKTDKTTCEEEIEASLYPSCGCVQKKAAHLNRCKNRSRRAVFK